MELRVVFFGNSYFFSDAVFDALSRCDCRIVAGVLPPIVRKQRTIYADAKRALSRIRPVSRAAHLWTYARLAAFGRLAFAAKEPPARPVVDDRWRSWVDRASVTGLPILRPANVREAEGETFSRLASFNPHLLLSAGYTRVLGHAWLQLASIGAYNFHPSPLPMYKGSHPVFFALRDGARSLTMTCHEMTANADEGDIAYRQTIAAQEACCRMREAYSSLIEASLWMVPRLIEDARQSRIPRIAQTGEASLVGNPRPDHYQVAWTVDAWLVHRRVCLYEGNGWIAVRGMPVLIAKGVAADGACHAAPGTVLAIDRRGISVACGGGTVFLVQEVALKPPYPTRHGNTVLDAEYAAPRLGIRVGDRLDT